MALCNRARPIVHSAQPTEVVQPTGAFRPSRLKQGIHSPPPSLMRPRRPILASRWRGGGAGVADEEACPTGSRWEVVKGTEANWCGLSAVRWLMMMAQTSGCQSRTQGREPPKNNEEAYGAVSQLK
jgi:hypothetical protein